MGSVMDNSNLGKKISHYFRDFALLGLISVFSLVSTNVVVAQTLGTPANIVDPYADVLVNQVGDCLEQYGSNSCTANDFRITSIDIIDINDGCSAPDDYFQIDALISFSKATPARYDIAAWFYRGDDQDILPDPNFVLEDAIVGGFCTRVTLEDGLDIINPDGVTVEGVTANAVADQTGGDICVDVPGTVADSNIEQTALQLVLPCRDVGTADPLDPQADISGTALDGIVDISACTSWANSANSGNINDPNGVCDGPEYDGLNEAQPETGSKCNCGEFNGSDPQVSIPEIGVTKACSPTEVEPGETTTCTITMSNTGTGTMLGASAVGEDGFFYQDNYPESQGSVDDTTFSITPGVAATQVVDGFLSNNPADQSLNIYPGDIAPGDTVVVTYDFVTRADQTDQSISNIVCAAYHDDTQVYDYDVCDTQIITTPVSLINFEVVNTPTGYFASWQTATETNNLGFNVYGRLGQTLFKLNSTLIPSKVIDSLETSSYSMYLDQLIAPGIKSFYLEDIDLVGKATKHGPFKLSSQISSDQEVTVNRTDWAAIKSNNAKSKKSSKNAKASLANNSNGKSIAIRVSESGIQRISFDALAAMGFKASTLKLGRFELVGSDGQPLSVRVVQGKGRTAGYIEFLVDIERTFYADNSYVIMRAASRNGSAKFMADATSASGSSSPSEYYMHTETIADDNVYSKVSRIKDDPWMIERLFALFSPAISTVSLPVSEAYTASGVNAEVTTQIAGGLDFPDEVDHSVDIYANSQLIASADFDGFAVVDVMGELELNEQQSEVSIDLALTPINARNVSVAYPNSYSLRYPRKYVAINNSLVLNQAILLLSCKALPLHL
jgi:hypothetical protein